MNFKKMISVLLLFCFSFGAGSLAASVKEQRSGPVAPAAASADGNWGLSFQTEGKPPTANATADELMQYNASYAQMTDEKVLYLTFDAGYENGNTPAILDALKKHRVPAAFFVVGKLPGDQPGPGEAHDLRRPHRSQPHLSPPGHVKDRFKGRLSEGAHQPGGKFQEITGQAMPNTTGRPRENTRGKPSDGKDLGYHTFFWSHGLRGLVPG